jgi:hypothetical protein
MDAEIPAITSFCRGCKNCEDEQDGMDIHEMNVPLLHNIHEILVSYCFEAFRSRFNEINWQRDY